MLEPQDHTLDAMRAYFQPVSPAGEAGNDPGNPETEAPKEKQGPPLILGKYKTEDEARRGMHSLIQMATAERGARQRLETEVKALKDQMSKQQVPNGEDPF